MPTPQSPLPNLTADDPVNVSYEFFPPKDEITEQRLWKTISRLQKASPEFVSVTYGAGGTTQTGTLSTVTRLARDTPLLPAAHLTCVGKSRAEVDAVANELWDSGVRHIVALRGDPREGIGNAYTPRADGYAYSSDLVAGLKELHDFEISVSAYPERHPESGNWDAEIDNLKRKVDNGADRALTQFFFQADTFLSFRDRVAAAGIDIPIVPGIMLQPNAKGLQRMANLCGVSVPQWYSDKFDGLDKDKAARTDITREFAVDLVTDLYDGGVRDFHIYTLNRSGLALDITRLLGQA